MNGIKNNRRSFAAIMIFVGMFTGYAYSASSEVSFENSSLRINIADGNITGFIDKATGKNYLASGEPAPLLQVRLVKDGGIDKNYAPSAMKASKSKGLVMLEYRDIGVTALLKVTEKKSHIKFKVVGCKPKGAVDVVLWGPYPTTIGRTIAECVGVVYNKDYALGIQALNIKTLGGYPRDRKFQDKLVVCSQKDENVYDDFCEDAVVRDKQRMWGTTAWRKSFGSVLQAFCRDRTKSWNISPGYRTDIYPDCKIAGSAIALFGCSGDRKKILNTLGAIEISEGLPHPVLANGEWVKTAEDTKTIFLAGASPATLDSYIKWAKNTPVKAIYWDTPGPFADYGVFKRFYCGDQVYEEWVKKIKDAGYWNATLCLSNMLTPNSPYVKNGDSRLASCGYCELAAGIDAAVSEIEIKNPTPEVLEIAGGSNGIRFDHELVTYSSVTKAPPYKLLGCRRGAFNSKAAAHSADTEGHKMVLNPIRGNAALNAEIAANLAHYYDKYDIRVGSHDGIEFVEPEGHGEYSKLRFFDNWYNAFPKDKKYRPVMSASNSDHFMWHYIGRHGWGDEGGSFSLRTGNKEYRNQNQNYYWRNFLPAFMGELSLKKSTTPDEAEWFFAIAAGFNAGYRVKICSPENPDLFDPEVSKEICKAMTAWEEARRAKVFPREIMKYMQDNTAEFHIEEVGKGRWKLYPRPNPKDRTQLGEPIELPLSRALTDDELKRFAPPVIKKYKVTATSELPGSPASAVTDGLINLASYWAASPYPQSLTIDLDGEETLHGVHLWPFFSSGRYFQYTVEVSSDGENWQQVVDMSKNTKTPTSEGARFVFDSPVKCKYIRVNMLYHNQNKGVYLTEVKWF